MVEEDLDGINIDSIGNLVNLSSLLILTLTNAIEEIEVSMIILAVIFFLG